MSIREQFHYLKQWVDKTMWTDYFNFIKLRRGRVITPSHGEIDFSREDIPVEVCRELFERGFPYLELTEAGKKELYYHGIDTIEDIIPISLINILIDQLKKVNKKQIK